MISEAMQFIRDLVSETIAPDAISPKGNHSRARTIVWKDGSRTDVMAQRAPRTQNVKTLESFVTAVEMTELSRSVVVYCQLGEIAARPAELNNDTADEPDDRIVFKFDVHPLLGLLKKTPGPVELSHSALMEHLKFYLGDVTFSPDTLLDTLRVVNFSALSESESESAKDLVKLGKRVTSLVAGLDKVPDMFSVQFQPTPAFPLAEQSIAFGLIAKPDFALFRLTPKAGSAAKAIAAAENGLCQLLKTALGGEESTAIVLAGWRD